MIHLMNVTNFMIKYNFILVDNNKTALFLKNE